MLSQRYLIHLEDPNRMTWAENAGLDYTLYQMRVNHVTLQLANIPRFWQRLQGKRPLSRSH